MAHNRAERRRKTALIKRRLERAVQRDLVSYAYWENVRGTPFCFGRASYQTFEQAVRRRRFKNEGRNNRLWRCGCEWCIDGFYHKHYQRDEALENDLREYLSGGYDALRAEGDSVPSAPILRSPGPMKKWDFK
jgi:hypothetical protein